MYVKSSRKLLIVAVTGHVLLLLGVKRLYRERWQDECDNDLERRWATEPMSNVWTQKDGNGDFANDKRQAAANSCNTTTLHIIKTILKGTICT